MNVFDKAKNLLQEKGWIRRELRNASDGSMCLLGALYYAENIDLMSQEEIECHLAEEDGCPYAPRWTTDHLARVIKKQDAVDGIDSPSVCWEWNDNSEDVDQVIHLLKKASEEFELVQEQAKIF